MPQTDRTERKERFTPGPYQHAGTTHRYEGSDKTQTFHPATIYAIDPDSRHKDLPDGHLKSVCMVYGIPQNCTMEELRDESAKGVTRYEEPLATAALFSAAPDLYEALKRLVSELPAHRDWLDPDLEATARAALSKARGETK